MFKRTTLTAALLVTQFTGLAEANTDIRITNCANSSHILRVYAWDKNGLNGEKLKLSIGAEGKVNCDTGKCKLHFKAGSKTTAKTTDKTQFYVLVSEDDKMDIEDYEMDGCK